MRKHLKILLFFLGFNDDLFNEILNNKSAYAIVMVIRFIYVLIASFIVIKIIKYPIYIRLSTILLLYIFSAELSYKLSENKIK